VRKARVFISCGQKPEEKPIGLKVAKYLRRKGFDPYFAEEIQTPEALTKEIFDSLRNSEYFVAINFQRKKLKKGDIGSLFIQQEFAIAAFLRISMIAFHKGNIKPAGVGEHLILKSIAFESYENIIRYLSREVKKWDPNSTHQLKLESGNHHSNFVTANAPPGTPLSNWFHIVVQNRSNSIYCKNCYGYIEMISDLKANKLLFGAGDYKTELLWAGTNDVTVNIPQGGKRDLDMLTWYQGTNIVTFQQRTTSTGYKYPDLPFGKYYIVYGVISDNFPTAKIEIEIEFSRTGITFLRSRQFE
jgi:predicted nucleic-acid-binding Zn-ribbon protein